MKKKNSLLLFRERIDCLDTQLWATIEERLTIWSNIHRETDISYREELSKFFKKNKNLFKRVNQDFFLKFLVTMEVFCKKEGTATSSENVDYGLIVSKDKLILNILEKRFEVAYKIGLLKKKKKTAITDSVRYQQILDLTQKKIKILKIPRKMVVSLMGLIHDYSVKMQEKI